MKILIIQLKHMGDVLMTLLIANNIKTKIPNAKIHFLCYTNHSLILENNPFIDKIIKVNEKDLKKIKTLLKTIKSVRKEKYDYIIDPYCKLQSKLICSFSSAKHRIGFKKIDWMGSYTELINIKNTVHSSAGLAIDNRLSMIHSIVGTSKLELHPKIYLTPKESKRAKHIMIEGGVNFQKPIIMIGILGSKDEKTYPLNYMGELINFIAKNYNVDILLNYIPKQKHKVEEIMHFVNNENKIKIKTKIIGNTIRELSAIMSLCNLNISNEGGSCHISKALDIPTFSIFSPYIELNTWDSFASKKNQSVHLSQYRRDLYKNFKQKKYRKNSTELYEFFKFSYFRNKLNNFIKTNLNCY